LRKPREKQRFCIKPAVATAAYREWFRRLRESPNCEAIADCLNELKVPTGPYSRGHERRWTGKTVRRITRNSLLKGTPGRGFKVTVKNNGGGRSVPVRNPDRPGYREFPRLAHVRPAEFDEVNALPAACNKKYTRRGDGGEDSRKGVAKKRTRFPGHHIN
jgi:hypothetical protein